MATSYPHDRSQVPVRRFVRPPYVADGAWWQRRSVGTVVAILLAALYGWGLAQTYPSYLKLLIAPVMGLVALAVWLVSERTHRRFLHVLLFVFLVGLLCWPDYLALTVSDLPWITFIRLVGVPMMLVLLVAGTSWRAVRDDIIDTLRACPWVSRAFFTFLATGVVSLALTKNLGDSLNRFAVAQMAWTSVFLVSCLVFRVPGRATLFVRFLWGIVLFNCVIALMEWRRGQVPWAGHIPAILEVQDENVQRFLAGSARAASGIYRLQSKFTTPLGLSEFLAIATPFILHLMMTAKGWKQRIGAGATIVVMFFCILRTDSRLGVVGFLLSLLIYSLIWAILTLRRDRRNLLARAIIAGYPLVLAGAAVSTVSIGAIRYRVFGGGAQSFSTQSRKVQYQRGIPMVIAQPIGHGVGMGATTLGYVDQSGLLTIDTYYLVIALEYGIIGFIAYYGMFGAAVFYGAKALPHAVDNETELIGPLIIAFIVFIIIKSVFSQQENHPLLFMMLGLMLVLVRRVQVEREKRTPEPVFVPARKARATMRVPAA